MATAAQASFLQEFTSAYLTRATVMRCFFTLRRIYVGFRVEDQRLWPADCGNSGRFYLRNFLEPTMQLTLQSQLMEDVVVIRCQGRIVAGAEVEALQAELEKQTKIPGTNFLKTKRVVLQLAEADFIDSSGVGALVRMFGVLGAAGGGLKLCQLSPFVLRVLQITNLLSVFLTYSSEREAIEAFFKAARSPQEALKSSRARIVCIDTSSDLLAYVSALFKSSGYDVFTTRHLGDA